MKYTQSKLKAAVFPTAESVAIARTVLKEIPYVSARAAEVVDGGFIIPVVRFPLNRRSGLPELEYIA